jgi:predicted AAA+ superfamily ATPase
LVRDYCKRNQLNCLEINFERDPRLRALFVEGHNNKTIQLLQAHFNQSLANGLLFLDEIQTAPEVFARLRYFFEDTPHVPVVAAGSLLDFALGDLEHGMPVGRIQYMHLGPLVFEEYLAASDKCALLDIIKQWSPQGDQGAVAAFHQQLLDLLKTYLVVGGMPQVAQDFLNQGDFASAQVIQRSILDTYEQDFAKYKKRIPFERLQRVLAAVPLQLGRKWVHARINPQDKAESTFAALDALAKARVVHLVYHSSANGLPLAAQRKDNYYKVLFLDVGLAACRTGVTAAELEKVVDQIFINQGALAEQFIGQHLLDLRPLDKNPEIHCWTRQKPGSMAEVDYLLAHNTTVIPVEVKAGPSTRAKSLGVFMQEKSSPLAIHFYGGLPVYDEKRRVLKLPLYMVGQLERLLNQLIL